jgi:5-formyltetrahydrofolate cyclo-ligase
VKSKHEQRQLARERRRVISDDERGFWNQLIFERAHKFKAFQLAKVVHLYRSSPEEVWTDPLFEYAWATGKRTIVPVVDGNELIHVEVDQTTTWTTGAFGIREPLDRARVVDLRTVQGLVMYVPMVAFDARCNRIGYGKGYYDKLLSSVSAISIGLAYECQRVVAVQHEAHDVALDCVVTEHRLYVP